MLGVSQLRVTVGLVAGALALHQARYVVAYADSADAALQEHGHGYLKGVIPVLGVVLALLLAHLLHRIAAGTERHTPVRRRTAKAAVPFAAGLLAIYTTQELVEGLLVADHPGGLDGVFGHGGWLALPLAALLGLGLSLFVHGVRSAVERVRRSRRVCLAAMGPANLLVPAAEDRRLRATPLARHLAGRAPPLPVA